MGAKKQSNPQPDSPIGRLYADLQGFKLTRKDQAAVSAMKGSPGYAIMVDVLSRSVLACGQNALDDGQVAYWSGVRAGLNLFFDYIGESAVLLEKLRRLDPLEVEARQEDEDEATPQFTLGGSSL